MQKKISSIPFCFEGRSGKACKNNARTMADVHAAMCMLYFFSRAFCRHQSVWDGPLRPALKRLNINNAMGVGI